MDPWVRDEIAAYLVGYNLTGWTRLSPDQAPSEPEYLIAFVTQSIFC